MPFLIKICGVTSPEDAALVSRAGADAVGLNFWPGSRRFVGADVAAVVAAIPPTVLKVGVFVNAPVAEVLAAQARWGLDWVQLHGDESARDYAAVPGAGLVRAVRVRGAESFAEIEGWHARHFLFDAFVDGYGGGGQPAPWALIAAYAARRATMPVGDARPSLLLAGGLTPDNVAEAIAATSADGVDVASGVESAPGRKDARLVARFIEAARRAAHR